MGWELFLVESFDTLTSCDDRWRRNIKKHKACRQGLSGPKKYKFSEFWKRFGNIKKYIETLSIKCLGAPKTLTFGEFTIIIY